MTIAPVESAVQGHVGFLGEAPPEVSQRDIALAGLGG